MLKRLVTILHLRSILKVGRNFHIRAATKLVSVASEFKMEHLQNNPYYDKYAAKLKHLQQSSPEQLQQKLNEFTSNKGLVESNSKDDDCKHEVQVKTENLDSIMKLELVKQKSSDEIAELWTAYHTNKDCVYALIPAGEYQEIHQKSKDFPVFLYPVPREEGYEFFVQRWSGHVCHFTPLISYQAYGENAVSCLSLMHYTELMQDKGIVLMTGEPTANVLSVYESQLLALQVKMYYGVYSGLKFNYVRMFNNSPESFRHSDLIREFENYKKDLKEQLTRDD